MIRAFFLFSCLLGASWLISDASPFGLLMLLSGGAGLICYKK